MNEQEKELLVRYLCAALPYGVVCYYKTSDGSAKMLGKLTFEALESFVSNKPLRSGEDRDKAYGYSVESIKPYLRTRNGMTEFEREEWGAVLCDELSVSQTEWLLEHHFDFKGFIDKGLAFAVTENFNPYTEETSLIEISSPIGPNIKL